MQTEREFLHELANHITTATTSLEMVLEEMDEAGQKDTPQRELLDATSRAVKALATALQERREIVKAQAK